MASQYSLYETARRQVESFQTAILKEAARTWSVKASFKTHLSGEGTLLESGDSPHGGRFYRFVVNIDGQAVTWEVKGVRENSPIVNSRHFPDEGEGMRYVLEKKILAACRSAQHIFCRTRRELYQNGDRQLAGGQILYLGIPTHLFKI